jgi:hypothetical protein
MRQVRREVDIESALYRSGASARGPGVVGCRGEKEEK